MKKKQVRISDLLFYYGLNEYCYFRLKRLKPNNAVPKIKRVELIGSGTTIGTSPSAPVPIAASVSEKPYVGAIFEVMKRTDEYSSVS